VKVVVTHSARRHFREVLSFYSGYMTRREVSKRASDVHAALKHLGEHPGHGAFEDNIKIPGRRYRRVVVGDLKIIYYVTGKTIRVTDIFDSRQDPKKMKG
jgi:plasmid stabilization system protein ParE